jgi:hypothetical protein
LVPAKEKGKIMLQPKRKESRHPRRPAVRRLAVRVPRQDEPGPYYGHPAVFIEPRGEPLGITWAVLAADGGAWDRHFVRTWTDTEEEAEQIAADIMTDPNFYPIPV